MTVSEALERSVSEALGRSISEAIQRGVSVIEQENLRLLDFSKIPYIKINIEVLFFNSESNIVLGLVFSVLVNVFCPFLVSCL
mgnify:CR=1 FL=1